MPNSYPFPRHVRLLSSHAYQQVFSAPVVFHGASFRVLVRAVDNPTSRLGVIVAKKQIKKAHARNRIRRLVRESFRLQQHKLPAVDIIVMVKALAAHQDNNKVFEELALLWKKLQTSNRLPSSKPVVVASLEGTNSV